MKTRWPRWRMGRGPWRAMACRLLAATVVAIPVWQSVQAQGPTSGVRLELVNEDEDWIERKKHGELRARPLFNRQLSTLYYGIRDADTGEWLTAMYRVSGGEQERDEGWEYEFDYPALDEHELLDPDRAYLMVILAATSRQPSPTTFYAVVPLHQPGGLLGSLLRALRPGGMGAGRRRLGDRRRARHALRRAGAADRRRAA